MRLISGLTKSRPRVAILASVATIAVIGGVTVVRAAIPDGSNVIHACYSTTNGALSVINTKTTSCASGTNPLSWPAYTGLNGLAEFTAGGTWKPPEGVTHVLVEAWGAGGGGGGGTTSPGCGGQEGGSGGGGGGGGYLRVVVPVKSHLTYSVTVGVGGAGGGVGQPGTAGGDSVLFLGTSQIAAARGGGGGGSTASCSTPGGAGGTASGNGGIARQGNAGAAGSGDPNISPGAGGGGIRGTFEGVSNQGSGGSGGSGEDDYCSPTCPATGGTSGTQGYVLLTW
jgi:hypothetical protein